MKILGRNEFINEVYNPMMEEKRYKELQAINEGILSTIFGGLKNLMGLTGWKRIKGDQSIIKKYEEIDKKLTGFTTMKLNKSKQCDKVRQELVEFAETWYDAKMEETKKDDKNLSMAKSMKFDDETLKTALETCNKNIEHIINGDNQMKTWADLLMQNMKNVINNAIKNEIKDEEELKKIEEQEKEDAKKAEEYNKKMEELQSEELKQIEADRSKLISDAGATEIDKNLNGDKAIQNLCDEFKNIMSEMDKIDTSKKGYKTKILKVLGKDTFTGLKNIYTKEDLEDDKSNLDKDNKETSKFMGSWALIKTFYDSLEDRNVMKKFENTPSGSVQAMCIATNAFIKYCTYGGTDYGNFLPIMTKCAIVSNGVASFNLPVNDDEENPGNFFTDTVALITNGTLGESFIKQATQEAKDKATGFINKIAKKVTKNEALKNLLSGKDNEFTQNAKTLASKIKSEAEKAIEDVTKAHNDAVEKFDNNKENNE